MAEAPPRLLPAVVHLEAARRALMVSYERPDGRPGAEGSIADELERIDAALGPKGKSLLFALAQSIREAEAEIRDALKVLAP
ncbi:MAG: hypothetical protein ACK4Z0_05715 [Sphingomonadaceae bacterium]